MTIHTSVKILRKTRRLVLQALYQWQLNKASTLEIELQFRNEHQTKTIDWIFFRELFTGVISVTGAIDTRLEPILDRKLSDLDPIELALLRLGSFELQNQLQTPYKVIINESVELARTFGAQDSYKYINAILDTISSQIPVRNTEKQLHKKSKS